MAALAAILFPIAFIVPVQAIGNVAFILGSLTLIALPLAIAVAILRYRLFEIDRIISRTLSYAIVTGLLGAVFVGVILAAADGVRGRARRRRDPRRDLDTSPCSRSSSPSCAASAGRSTGASTERAIDGERTAGEFAERLRWETDMAASPATSRATVEGAVVADGSSDLARGGAER